MKWYKQSNHLTSAKWFYFDRPCDIVALGVDDGEKHPRLMRVVIEGALLTIEVDDQAGEFPGISYEAPSLN